jgi:hypothetical protein
VRRHERKATKARERGLLRPLCVVLLPTRLQQSPMRERIEDLLTAPGAVRVEPAPLGYGMTGRLPLGVRERIALGQAKRLPLPGEPRAVVAVDARQYPLAGALLVVFEGAELWYGGDDPPKRLADLHEAAQARAAITFGPDPEAPAHELNRPLWERMEALGIESGRLGSERISP